MFRTTKKEKMFALTDAMPIDYPDHLSIIKGDAKSISIAGASILAKVTRDRLMEAYALEYPEYGFEKHKGYVTKAHKEALGKYGVCPIHRKSFGPVQDIIKNRYHLIFNDIFLILKVIFKFNGVYNNEVIKIWKNLIIFSLKYAGDFDSILKALECDEKIDEKLKKELFKDITANYTTLISPDYPTALKEIACPPFVLFYYGNLALVKNKCISVIGKRHPSTYGVECTAALAAQLVEAGYTIISGMAMGIDTIAHQSTITANGQTIAVLGSGIDYCYPHRNQQLYQVLKDHHLVISEYPGKFIPQKINFPRRNRIISGLSESILVTEANQQSGTMITVGRYLFRIGKRYILCS